MKRGTPARTLPAVDAVRLVSAAWVGFSHLGGPPIDEVAKLLGIGSLMRPVNGLVNTLFCGPAAVMVFFVISGFCIHHPYINGQTFRWRGFLLSRLTRILLPMVIAMAIFDWCGETGEINIILWSVYCEIIYYTIYPILRQILPFTSLRAVVFASFVVSVSVIVFYPWKASNEWRIDNHAITAMLLAPGWLLGCLLAEMQVQKKVVSEAIPPWWASLAALRTLVFILSALAQLLHFHSPICYRYTLTPFSIVVFVWLASELQNFQIAPWLANAGKACYSIYLMHTLARPATTLLLPSANPLWVWIARLMIVIAISTAFYWSIERPSHQLARKLRNC